MYFKQLRFIGPYLSRTCWSLSKHKPMDFAIKYNNKHNSYNHNFIWLFNIFFSVSILSCCSVYFISFKKIHICIGARIKLFNPQMLELFKEYNTICFVFEANCYPSISWSGSRGQQPPCPLPPLTSTICCLTEYNWTTVHKIDLHRKLLTREQRF